MEVVYNRLRDYEWIMFNIILEGQEAVGFSILKSQSGIYIGYIHKKSLPNIPLLNV